MEVAASITSLFLLSAVVWQDFKSRSISAWLCPAFGVLLMIVEVHHAKENALLQNMGINFILLLIQFLILSLWISLRCRKWTNIIDSHIGLGDLIFLVCVAPVLSPLNFCILLTAGSLLTLIVHLLFLKVKPDSDPKIPLAGYLGVIVLIFSLLSLCRIIPVHLSDAEWLANYFIS